MKKIGDMMQEMGFRKDAPDSVKEAFLKHLIKVTTGVDLQTPSEKKNLPRPEQLSFNFSSDQSPIEKKVS